MIMPDDGLGPEWDAEFHSQDDEEFVTAIGEAIIAITVSKHRTMIDVLGAMEIVKQRFMTIIASHE